MLDCKSDHLLNKSYRNQPKDSKVEVLKGDVDSTDKAFRT